MQLKAGGNEPEVDAAHLIRRPEVVDEEDVRPPVRVTGVHIAVGDLLVEKGATAGVLRHYGQTERAAHGGKQCQPAKAHPGQQRRWRGPATAVC